MPSSLPCLKKSNSSAYELGGATYHPHELHAREKQARDKAIEPYLIVVRPRLVWGVAIPNLQFCALFVEELLKRPWQETEAYLSLGWRVGKPTEEVQPGDQRQLVAAEQFAYIQKLLEVNATDLSASELAILNRACEWFKRQFLQANMVLDREIASASANEVSKIKLKLRQVALMYIYERWPLPKDQADSIVQRYGNTSGHKLYTEYLRYSRSVNERTGVEGKAVDAMIKSIEGILPDLSEAARKRAEDNISILKEEKKLPKVTGNRGW